MQRLSLKQALTQKLSPQQIQFIKLLQVPTAELDTRIEKELEENPALEEGAEDEEGDQNSDENEREEVIGDDEPNEDGDLKEQELNSQDDINVDDYIQDDFSGYKMMGDGPNPDEEDKSMPIESQSSLLERMESQIGFQEMDERQKILAKQIIGSLDSDGYLRRELESIANDLLFSQEIEVSEEELENVLFKIQEFDPPGVGARSLKESLLIRRTKC